MEKLKPQLVYEFNNGDNKLATLRDVNSVIDAVNAQGIFTSVNLIVSHLLGFSPTFEIVGKDTAVDCPPDCSIFGGNCNCITFTNTGAGVYTLTFDSPLTITSVIVSPLKEGFYNAGVEIVSDTEILIKTYNIATGAYEDNLLDNTYIEIKIWE